MQMSKQEWYSIMINRLIIFLVIFFFSGFISFIAVNGTNEIYGKEEVQNITYKLPDSWIANISDKQFRLLELSLIDGSDFNVVLFANIQGTADQNIQRWIGQFKKDELLEDNVLVQKDSLDNKYITLLEMYGTYEVPNMANPSQEKVIKNDYGLLGGVIEFPNSLYFIKAVGINSIISENSDNYREFVYSIRLN